MTLRRSGPRLIFLLLLICIGVLFAARLGLVDLPRKYDPLALPDLNETPHWLTGLQMKLVDADAQNCSFALTRAGLPASLQPTRGKGTSCERAETVLLSRLSTARLRPEETRCNIAARLYMWERHVLQPLAQASFGEPIVEITHFGSFSCRTIAGTSSMSEHANANAFDISGFRLKSGKMVSVLKDWNGPARESDFLHRARDGACSYFNLALSPDYNAAHKDHFHLDMGWARGCY